MGYARVWRGALSKGGRLDIIWKMINVCYTVVFRIPRNQAHDATSDAQGTCPHVEYVQLYESEPYTTFYRQEAVPLEVLTLPVAPLVVQILTLRWPGPEGQAQSMSTAAGAASACQVL